MNPSNGTQRLPALDGLRAIAVWGVILLHLAPTRFLGGHVGVDVFFALSGFLITRNVMLGHARLGSPSLIDFYLKRIARIYPALILYLTTAISFSLLPFAPSDTKSCLFSAGISLVALNHLHFLFGLQSYPWFSHLWSLSIEETFYLLWPPFIILFSKYLNILTAIGLGAFALILSFSRMHSSEVTNIWSTAWFALCRYDSLLYGCALALFEKHVRMFQLKSPTNQYALAIMAATLWLCLFTIIAIVFSADKPWVIATGTSLTAISTTIATAVILMEQKPSAITRFLEKPFLVYSGEISYGLFLWHYPFSNYFTAHSVSVWISAPITLGATYLLAGFSSRYLEKPIRILVRKKNTSQSVVRRLGEIRIAISG